MLPQCSEGTWLLGGAVALPKDTAPRHREVLCLTLSFSPLNLPLLSSSKEAEAV